MDYFGGEFYINDRPVEISPSGSWLEVEPKERSELPPGARRTFEAIIEQCRKDEWELVVAGEIDIDELRSLSGDDLAEAVDDEIEFGQVMGGAVDVWQMGIHHSNWPINPTGHDFYVRADGTYLGFCES